MATVTFIKRLEKTFHFIRGCKVVLDRDLANFFEIETGRLNQAARRNIDSFPHEDFFQLTEYELLATSQNGDAGRGQHLKFLPHAYTEYSVLAFANILKTPKAKEVGKAIVQAFLAFRDGTLRPTSRTSSMAGIQESLNEINSTLCELVRCMTESYARRPLPPLLSQPPPPAPKREVSLRAPTFSTAELIQKSVAHAYGLQDQDLKRTTRARSVALPRQVAIFLIRKHSQLSLLDIAKFFRLSDHTTVMYACRRTEQRLREEPGFQRTLFAIEQELETNVSGSRA